MKGELMQDPLDLDLQNTAPPPGARPPGRRSPAAWMAAAVIVAILGVAAYWYYARGIAPALPVPAQVSDPADAPPPPQPLGGQPEPIDVPPLDMSDEVVRKLVTSLSSHPRVAAWLATDGLVRNFTVAVENISNGRSPAGHLSPLRPRGAFTYTERGDRLFVDPRGYDRYSSLAEAVASIDPDGAARLYATLKPRIEEAYRELGHDESFDSALERAIVSLLAVPDVEGDVELEPQGGVYQYANPRFEGMTSAQKQLLRMGPRNMRVIQRKLREIALALGIPPERLPGG
jgi:hypothetical protein